MGGAVSSGRDNNELIDNLMGGNYIRSPNVERVFRALDRAEYMTPDARDQAYKDLAWRNGYLHMSAPCIYSEVVEGLELKPGLSFLNVGSGTGYLSTMIGLIIGSSGINHGIEVHPSVLEYAVKRLGQFIENSPILDDFDFCVPKFYGGNGLCLSPQQAPYDRLYCGAGCPLEFHAYFKQLIKIGGILVMPLGDNLVQIKRTAVDGWTSRNLLNVSFAALRLPTKEESANTLKLEEQTPPRLQVLSRAVVRASMRASLMSRHPHLREPPPEPPRAPNTCPRRICIPIEDDSDVEGLNALHDLDHVNGGNEMNALLSLVLSMGQNRVAGALRFDSLDSQSSSSSSAEEDNGGGGNNDDNDDRPDRPDRPNRPPRSERPPRPDRPPRSERPPRAERSARSRPDQPDNTERSDPTDTPDRPEQSDNRRSSSEPPVSDEPPRSRIGSLQLPGSIRTHHGLITFEIQDGRSSRNSRSAGSSRRDSAGTSGAKSASDNDTDTNRKLTGVPAEVEIYLGKASTSRSEMDWESTSHAKRECSSDEDATDTSKEKRKKLDSGIGEGTTTSSGSSPIKSESNEGDESDVEVGRSDNMSEGDAIAGRRRRPKRGRCALGPRSTSTTSGSDDDSDVGVEDAEGVAGAEGAGGAAGVTSSRRRKRRAASARRAEYQRALDELRPRRNPQDARRVRLSILMKRGVKDLPLPYALKKYVNLGRCFEF